MHLMWKEVQNTFESQVPHFFPVVPYGHEAMRSSGMGLIKIPIA